MMWLLEVAFVLMFAMSWYPCCCDTTCTTTCTNCLNDAGPCSWQVEISGYTKFGSTSCACENFNGTHITPESSSSGCTSPQAVVSLSGSGCISGGVYVNVIFESALYKIQVLVEMYLTGVFGSGYQSDEYEADYGTKPDCVGASGVTCDYVTTTYGNVYGQRCVPPASVTVTAL